MGCPFSAQTDIKNFKKSLQIRKTYENPTELLDQPNSSYRTVGWPKTVGAALVRDDIKCFIWSNETKKSLNTNKNLNRRWKKYIGAKKNKLGAKKNKLGAKKNKIGARKNKLGAKKI